MLNHPDRAVIIEGHTDNTGDEDFNRELSLNRAKAIGGALEARGVVWVYNMLIWLIRSGVATA